MRVKLLIARAGLGFSQNKDDVIEVDEAEGLRMIKSGQAVLVESVEKASKKPASEKATKKKGKK